MRPPTATTFPAELMTTATACHMRTATILLDVNTTGGTALGVSGLPLVRLFVLTFHDHLLRLGLELLCSLAAEQRVASTLGLVEAPQCGAGSTEGLATGGTGHRVRGAEVNVEHVSFAAVRAVEDVGSLAKIGQRHKAKISFHLRGIEQRMHIILGGRRLTGGAHQTVRATVVDLGQVVLRQTLSAVAVPAAGVPVGILGRDHVQADGTLEGRWRFLFLLCRPGHRGCGGGSCFDGWSLFFGWLGCFEELLVGGGPGGEVALVVGCALAFFAVAVAEEVRLRETQHWRGRCAQILCQRLSHHLECGLAGERGGTRRQRTLRTGSGGGRGDGVALLCCCYCCCCCCYWYCCAWQTTRGTKARLRLRLYLGGTRTGGSDTHTERNHQLVHGLEQIAKRVQTCTFFALIGHHPFDDQRQVIVHLLQITEVDLGTYLL
mmetsp:Transcript_42294/g.106690  ORF Transcript_42294/g.106690 Transcript_42294/m.106690 type:complete len:434 (+) Transcript_42294:392-1693(+)